MILNLHHSVWSRYFFVDIDLYDVQNQNEAPYYEALSDFNAVDSSVNVNRIGTENSQVAHVYVVEYSQVKAVSKEDPKHFRNHYRKRSSVCHKERERSYSWDNKLVPPLQVNDIIHESQQNNHGDCQKTGIIFDQSLCSKG